MKTRLYVIILVLLFAVSSCQKPPSEVIKDQKSIQYNEQAYPGIEGEINKFVINGDTLTYEKINGKYVFQGDMILTDDQLKLIGSSKGSGLESFVNKWINNTVIYRIPEDLPNKVRITDAIKYWESNTPIRFMEWDQFLDLSTSLHSWEIPTAYVMFKWDKAGCYSNVGMLGNKNIYYNQIDEQVIGLADWADKGTVIHEIGHTLGLIHEHSRLDRDQYIKINLENVESGKEYNFNKIRAQYNTSIFDFNSIMLYSSFAFSANGQPTITKLDGSIYDAQREVLSEGDINAINLIYLPPEVNFIRVSNITDRSATIGYDVTSKKEANVAETGIYWGTSPDPESTGTKKIIGYETGRLSTTMIGLSPNTTYYFKAFATNNEGTSYSDQVIINTFGVMDVDSNLYKTVIIGNQEWMGANLKTTKYNDGNPIPLVTDHPEWERLSTPAYCWYRYGDSYISTYGALYNWYAVNTGKLCPTGWHAPSESEWATLINYLGGAEIAGGKLKEAGTMNWRSPNTGATNETGFTALPGGWQVGNYGSMLWEQGLWWTATSSINDANNAWLVFLKYDESIIGLLDCCINAKYYGVSVRCIKD